jgi:hypothetical protein
MATANSSTPTSFDRFYGRNGKTPGNAARLAADDHAASHGQSDFVSYLRQAGDMADAHKVLNDALCSAYDALRKIAESSCDSSFCGAGNVARHALKAAGEDL